MSHTMKRYLYSVLRRRLDMEAQRWLSALESGFDVAVIVSEDLLVDVLEEYLQTGWNQSSRLVFELRILECDGSVRNLETCKQSQTHHTLHDSRVPMLSVLRKIPSTGLAAITYELPAIQGLLPSPPSIVTQVLETASLERYVDAFDGQKVTQLRKLMEKVGPEEIFDAIIQVAYLAGYRGDDSAAIRFLEEKLEQTKNRQNQRQDYDQKTSSSLEFQTLTSVFERILQLPDPHDVLKAALAHYVFFGRKVSQAEASRLLKVSRSTLQAHLQLAERLNVSSLFTQEGGFA